MHMLWVAKTLKEQSKIYTYNWNISYNLSITMLVLTIYCSRIIPNCPVALNNATVEKSFEVTEHDKLFEQEE